MPVMPAAPILVTGSVRSGTTWTGRVLGFSSDVGYVYEALNRRLWPDWLSVRLPHIYQYICEENAYLYEHSIQEVLSFRYPIQNVVSAPNLGHVAHMLDQYRLSLWYRLRRKRPLLKDPKGILLAEWFAQRFDANVVVMIRHPAGLRQQHQTTWLGVRFSKLARPAASHARPHPTVSGFRSGVRREAARHHRPGHSDMERDPLSNRGGIGNAIRSGHSFGTRISVRTHWRASAICLSGSIWLGTTW